MDYGSLICTPRNPNCSICKIQKYCLSYEKSMQNIIPVKVKKQKVKPLCFVGKGVCFDTGGISLKPARFMEEMKYDMGGSAVVVGLMKTLALRKAKVNAIGVVG